MQHITSHVSDEDLGGSGSDQEMRASLISPKTYFLTDITTLRLQKGQEPVMECTDHRLARKLQNKFMIKHTCGLDSLTFTLFSAFPPNVI